MKNYIIHVLLISAGISTAATRIREWDLPASNDVSGITTELASPFWPDQPGLWFRDNQEKLADELIAELEHTDNIEEISDILSDPPEMKYDAVKARLIAVHQRRLGEEPTGWLLGLVTGMELGDQKPSCLLKRIRNLAKYSSVDIPEVNLRQMWMKKLAPNVFSALVIRETMSECTLDDLAAVADKLMDFNSMQNQLRYIQGHMKPSELHTSMQELDCDTPDAFIQHTMIRSFPSFVGTAITVMQSMNNESTLEDLAILAHRTIWLKEENDRQLRNFQELLNTYGNENPITFLERMRSLTENMTPLHIWMYYLPEYMREAIIVKQSLNSSSTIQDLIELADKLQDLQGKTSLAV